MKPRMFIMLFICHAVPLFIGMGLFPLLPLYAARFGATRTDIGVFYAVVYIASTAGVLGTSWLAARVSRRALFFAGATLGIPALVLMGHATALWQVVLLTACVWLCGGITLTLLSVFTGVLADPASRGRVFGLMFLVYPVDALVGGTVVGYLTTSYGYTVMFNINICHNNMDDVKELTEIAHDNGIATDYHINETPMTEQDHFKHLSENETYLTRDDWPKVDALLDYLNDKRRNEGYKMVNPIQHMEDMKLLMRGQVPEWQCRAGQNSLIIRTDGSLAPCFPMYSATHDWGVVGDHKFDVKQLDEMKKECSTHCLSTCNYILGYCYDTTRVLSWIMKTAKGGFRGVESF